MGDKVRQPTSDVMMSWEMFWTYFSSDRCTDEMRTWTLSYTYLPDILSTASKSVQAEIMEYCPDYVKNLPDVVEALHGKTQPTVYDNQTTLQVPISLLIALAKRNAK